MQRRSGSHWFVDFEPSAFLLLRSRLARCSSLRTVTNELASAAIAGLGNRLVADPYKYEICRTMDGNGNRWYQQRAYSEALRRALYVGPVAETFSRLPEFQQQILQLCYVDQLCESGIARPLRLEGEGSLRLTADEVRGRVRHAYQELCHSLMKRYPITENRLPLVFPEPPALCGRLE